MYSSLRHEGSRVNLAQLVLQDSEIGLVTLASEKGQIKGCCKRY